MKFIDDLLNKITMYRLVLYVLIILSGIALMYSFTGSLPFSPVSFIITLTILVAVSWLTNTIFASVFDAQTNIESVYISALILVLIITPVSKTSDILFLIWAAVLTMASKYILAISKKHIFNPVAMAVFVTSIGINQSASWWVGTGVMLPFVLAGGMLIVRKVQRYDMVFSFMVTSVVMFISTGLARGSDPGIILQRLLINSPWVFFMTIMLTEPLTTPAGNIQQIIYGVLNGILFSPYIHIGSFFTTPELALLLTNIYSFIVSPKYKLVLSLKEKIRHSSGLYDFIFPVNSNIAYIPGQYMEWTLAHLGTDDRGSRRYVTLASSPTEDNLRIGIKFYEKSSSFKKKLLDLEPGGNIIASQLSGEFILPADQSRRLVFIAGGIGITPFRSMIKYLLDKNEKRDIALFYSNRCESEIMYRDVFDNAQISLGIKTIYVLTDKDNLPSGWMGKSGRINPDLIKEEVPDYQERLYYLSGPRSMVLSFKEVLKNMGIERRQIKTDFFPGFA